MKSKRLKTMDQWYKGLNTFIKTKDAMAFSVALDTILEEIRDGALAYTRGTRRTRRHLA